MGWRDQYKVHPAADVFPMMGDDELKALGEDIAANGLKQPIVFWTSSHYQHGEYDNSPRFVIDGRNRIEAMDRRRMLPVNCDFDVQRQRTVCSENPVPIIASLNLHRRHLTKRQQAELIVAMLKVSAEADVVSRQLGEKLDALRKKREGRPKDTVKEAAVKTAAEHGIGQRTVERAIAKAEGKTPKTKAEREEINAKSKATREANWETRRQEDLLEIRNPEILTEHVSALTEAWCDSGPEQHDHLLQHILKESDPVVLAIAAVESMDAEQLRRFAVAFDQHKMNQRKG
jgi:hypothetical protein